MYVFGYWIRLFYKLIKGLCVKGAYERDFNFIILGMLFLGLGGEVCLSVA